MGIFTDEIYKSLQGSDSVGVVYEPYLEGQLPMVVEDVDYGESKRRKNLKYK